jgi:hypothetical protein
MTTTKCPWCNGSDNDDPDPSTLCRTHEAEYEGLSVAELDRRDDEQGAEYREWVLGR